MRVAITGASGYVGSLLVHALANKGYGTLGLCRRKCEGEWNAYSLQGGAATLPWQEIDALIHAAHDFTPLTWANMVERNVDPSIALFRAAKTAGVERMILISSISAFEGCRSNYGKAKLLVEKEVLKLGGLVIRPGLVWGKSPGGVMGAIEKAVTKLPIVPYLTGSGKLAQYMVHEEDLANCVTVAFENYPSVRLINATNPHAVSMLRILQDTACRLHLKRIFFPVHWKLVMAGLSAIELCGYTPPFRSDSLVGLMFPNTNLTDSSSFYGVKFRSFGTASSQ